LGEQFGMANATLSFKYIVFQTLKSTDHGNRLFRQFRVTKQALILIDGMLIAPEAVWVPLRVGFRLFFQLGVTYQALVFIDGMLVTPQAIGVTFFGYFGMVVPVMVFHLIGEFGMANQALIFV
tara:strand:+ start:211 stop:579 length:369 start_codon:yes stop_codon:yes gene_type:complete